MTPFCFCSINQQKEKDTLNDIVSMLMEKRLDINLKNNYGQTALHEASQRGNLAAVDILVKHRAEINATTKYVKLLLVPRTFIYMLNCRNGETPLHYAARGGHLEVIKLLLANKADKHKRGKRGTALDVASNADVVRVIKMYRMPRKFTDEFQSQYLIKESLPSTLIKVINIIRLQMDLMALET